MFNRLYRESKEGNGDCDADDNDNDVDDDDNDDDDDGDGDSKGTVYVVWSWMNDFVINNHMDCERYWIFVSSAIDVNIDNTVED